MNSYSVYKSKGMVYLKDNSGTWEVSQGVIGVPYIMDKRFILKRVWIPTSTMCKYGEYDSYDEAVERLLPLIGS